MDTSQNESGKFRRFVRKRGERACKQSVQSLVQECGACLSDSSAWRICAGLGLKGQRTNRSPLQELWALVNWRLPDTTLAQIWKMDRSNLGKRRRRFKCGPPAWRLPRDTRARGFINAVHAQMRRATEFRRRGPVQKGRTR